MRIMGNAFIIENNLETVEKVFHNELWWQIQQNVLEPNEVSQTAPKCETESWWTWQMVNKQNTFMVGILPLAPLPPLWSHMSSYVNVRLCHNWFCRWHLAIHAMSHPSALDQDGPCQLPPSLLLAFKSIVIWHFLHDYLYLCVDNHGILEESHDSRKKAWGTKHSRIESVVCNRERSDAHTPKDLWVVPWL